MMYWNYRMVKWDMKQIDGTTDWIKIGPYYEICPAYYCDGKVSFGVGAKMLISADTPEYKREFEMTLDLLRTATDKPVLVISELVANNWKYEEETCASD